MKKLRLTNDRNHFWRLWSVRLSLLAGIISATALGIIGAYALLPSDWLPVVHDGFKQAVAYAALASAGLTSFMAAVSRIFVQPKLSSGDADP
ncbi:DUF7940 domain-containing protein [Stenotrophomonas maltophilia]|uniref:DUF7940 domain-containing protein n=1 Tax=Stenotrophomonas maltophilia TaxID=40324 RepID=UPI004053D6F4